MRKLFKWTFRLILLVLALLAVIVLFRNPILRMLAERQVREVTGMETIIGRVRIELRAPLVRLENVRLISPAEFGGGLFLDLPDVRLEYDSIALLFRRIRLHRVVFQLDEIRLVRTTQGRTNLEAVRERLSQRRLASWLAHWDCQYDGTDFVGFSVGRLKYLDAREPGKSEEIYVGVRDVTLKRMRSAEEILSALA